MPFIPPTIAAFKAQFFRDFPYSVQGTGADLAAILAGGVIQSVIVLDGGGDYPANCQITVTGNGTGASLKAVVLDGVIQSITVVAGGAGYTSAVVKAVPRGDPTDLNKVQDQDIANALKLAKPNPGLFGTQDEYSTAYLLLAAHYLVTALTASSMGVSGTAEWLTASKTAGNVSEAFQIPDRILRSPFLALISKTRYGAMYLSIIAPLLIGNAIGICGVVSSE